MPSKQRRSWRLLDSLLRMGTPLSALYISQEVQSMANLMTLYYCQREKLYTWGCKRRTSNILLIIRVVMLYPSHSFSLSWYILKYELSWFLHELNVCPACFCVLAFLLAWSCIINNSPFFYLEQWTNTLTQTYFILNITKQYIRHHVCIFSIKLILWLTYYIHPLSL